MTKKGLLRLLTKPVSLPSATISEGLALSSAKAEKITLEKGD
jgi:hypothetical protein